MSSTCPTSSWHVYVRRSLVILLYLHSQNYLMLIVCSCDEITRGSGLITPHAQHEQGKVISVGVLIYIFICLWTKIFFGESYFSDRLTFSNIRGMTSHQIYRLYHCFLHKRFPRVNQGFSYLMCTSLYLSGWMTCNYLHKRIGKYRHLVKWN